MKFWITKYALTSGIKEVEAEVCNDIENKSMDMIKTVESGFSVYYHKEGRDFHQTETDAIKRALEMGNKKVKALKKQADALEWKMAALRNRREFLHNNVFNK